MDTLIFVILLALPLVPTVFAWFRLRAKGYGRFLIVICFLASIVACYVVAYWMLIGTTDSTDRREALWFFFGTPLIWGLLAASLAYTVPDRKSRRIPGQRSSLVPGFFGWLSVVLGGAFSLFQLLLVINSDQDILGFLVSIAYTLLFAGYWFGVARRVRTAPAVLPDSEGSVLYLRAFDAEHQSFVTGHRSVLGRYTNQMKAHLPLAKGKRHTTVQLTLEDFLEEAVTAQIGPFVGLGNPTDSLPPDGATREYAPDAIWQERFLALARSAKCIVIALAESDNLQWELQQIRENGLCQKLCVFTSPRPMDRDELGSLSKALHSEGTRRDALASSWETSCETMRRAGYDCDLVCPGPGAAIAFDQNGKSLLLTTGASTPDDYITPVADWFKTGTKSGRWMPASCSSCQATIFQGMGVGASTASLCFSCQGEAELARMSRLDRVTERHPVLASIWGFLSLVIAGLLASSLSLDSTWLIVILWAAVCATPWVVVAGFQRARRVRSHEDMARSSTSTPSQSTKGPAAPPDGRQS